MNKKIILVSISRDENGLFQCLNDRKLDEVIEKLQKENQIYEIFHMKYLSSIENIAENLILIGDGRYCLFRNEENHELLNALVKQIQFLQPECSIEYVDDYTSEEDREEKQYTMTFVRGYYMSLVGNYPVEMMDGTIKHIKIDEKFTHLEQLNRMNELCNVNSSICMECTKSLENSEKKEHYEYLKKYLRENNILPMNFVCDDADSLYINGVQESKVKRIKKIPYHVWKEREKKLTEQIVYTLDTKDDILLFQEDLEFYQKTHTLIRSPFFNGQMYMFCRFLSKQDCTIQMLPQVTIKGNGRLCPCNQEKWEIGSIEESSLSELRTNCMIIDENQKVIKKCNTCKSNEYCSMCSFMPEFLEEHFCTLRKNYPFIADLFYETNVLIELQRKYKVFNQTSLDEIKISNRYFQSITEDRYTGEKEKEVLFYQYVFVIYCNNIYMIWSPITGKIYRISKECAIVAEFIFRRIPINAVQQLLMDMFEYSQDDSQFIVDSTIKNFKQSHLL